jgi:PAS domain S-box-containing protein
MAAEEYFAHETEILRQRIAALEQQGPEPPQQPSVIAGAAEALAVALEELRAANEELQQQNEDLAAANRRYQELFSLAPDAYLVTDVHGTIQEANGAASHLLKIRADYLVGKPLKVFMAGEEVGAFLAQLPKLRQGQRVQEWEVRLQPREGASFPAEFSIAPARGADGRVIGMRWLLRDISARKQAETALQQARDGLEQQVQARTAELAAANETLKAALQQKDRLLKEVHHRVKNNLQIVSSLLSLQAGNISDPEIRNMLTDSQQRVQSMGLMHELLYRSADFGRIDMSAYVRTAAAHLLRSYQADADQISMTVDAEGVFLEVDTAIPCGLLLTELVSNCLKHAFPDGRKGRVYLGLRSNIAGQVTLVVRDDGVGFPAGVDFRQPETLGLQLIGALTEQLRGTVSLVSGEGCEFMVIFPS